MANLNITSIASIQAVGQVETFTSLAKTNIVQAIKKFSTTISSSQFAVMGNLVCGLTQSDLDGISKEDFKANIKSLSLLNDANCNALGILYSKAIVAMGNTGVDSVLISEIGSVISGISSTDAKALDTRSIQALSENALKIMPATVVNSLSRTQIRAFSGDQLNALMGNPNSASFTDVTKSLLTSAVNNVDVTRTDVAPETVTVTVIKSNANTIESLGFILFSLISMINIYINRF